MKKIVYLTIADLAVFKFKMKPSVVLLFLFAFIINHVCAQTPGKIEKTNQVLLPNGWKISPAGRSLPLGDLPLNMALSPNKNMLAITNNGQSKQRIQLIDPKTEKQLDEIAIAKAWYGIKFSDDDKTLYVSGGNDNVILAYAIANKKRYYQDWEGLAG
jgi:DNA-binding beta-propeller fold protein YncE